jgi:GNAT superfamily N-acetyltransferase
MLVVSDLHRKKGIGSALVRAATGQNDQVIWVLRVPHSEAVADFYVKAGFIRSECEMERPRINLGACLG